MLLLSYSPDYLIVSVEKDRKEVGFVKNEDPPPLFSAWELLSFMPSFKIGLVLGSVGDFFGFDQVFPVNKVNLDIMLV